MMIEPNAGESCGLFDAGSSRAGRFAQAEACGSVGSAGSKLHRMGSSPAFTLIEMIVVVGIVLILVTLVVPAASAMWNQRKMADAENAIRGLLMTSRAKAMRADGGKHGLFFFVDEQGVQQIALIRQVDVDDLIQRGLLNLDPDPIVNRNLIRQFRYELILQNVFAVVEDRGGTLPAPIRAVPRYVVARVAGEPDDANHFSDVELSNNDVLSPQPNTNNVQRHRNYFTMIFSTDGHLLIGIDALILDTNELERTKALGDFTGLPVGDDGVSNPIVPVVENFYDRADLPVCIDPVPVDGCQLLPLLVVDNTNANKPVAISFPSVDGLLVYDDSLFNEFDVDKDKREFLLRTSQPMYVNRLTGSVVRGPVGEIALGP